MTTTPSLRSRVLLIDLLKAGAAQLIVLHHFFWFGPLGDQALAFGPAMAAAGEWLVHYGRYAVAVFIVTSGFLAAQTLSLQGLPPGDNPLCLIRDRYLRLIGPFAVALLLAVAGHLLARHWMGPHETLGSLPTVRQFLAHIAMLQGLLDVEALSAGVWYVAIDFQLYMLFVLLLWLGQQLAGRRPSADIFVAGLLLAVGLGSLLVFNRDARWDDSAFYFFGSYALGIASGWAIRSGQRQRYRLLILAIGALALWVDFRARIALAVATALLLGFGRLHMARREVRVVHYLGGTSYALFLVHFPVYLLVAGWFDQRGLDSPGWSALGLLLAWLASMLLADLFHRWVEQPFAHWRKRRWPCHSKRHSRPGLSPA